MEFAGEKKILHLVNATLRRSWRIFVAVQVTLFFLTPKTLIPTYQSLLCCFVDRETRL